MLQIQLDVASLNLENQVTPATNDAAYSRSTTFLPFSVKYSRCRLERFPGDSTMFPLCIQRPLVLDKICFLWQLEERMISLHRCRVRRGCASMTLKVNSSHRLPKDLKYGPLTEGNPENNMLPFASRPCH
jgi:hypothetical protein